MSRNPRMAVLAGPAMFLLVAAATISPCPAGAQWGSRRVADPGPSLVGPTGVVNLYSKGRAIASGLYFLELTADAQTVRVRVILLR